MISTWEVKNVKQSCKKSDIKKVTFLTWASRPTDKLSLVILIYLQISINFHKVVSNVQMPLAVNYDCLIISNLLVKVNIFTERLNHPPQSIH